MDLTKTVTKGGFGSLTSGNIDVVQGSVKSYGTKGQGTSANMGYKWPVEVTGSCVPKFITVLVYPLTSDFNQATDTGTFKITVAAEDAMTVDNTSVTTSPVSLRFQAALEMEEIKAYNKWFSDQENAEFLGAMKLAAFASASAASIAALTLF